MAQNELPTPELTAEAEVIEEIREDRSYKMTAGWLSYVSAWLQLLILCVLVVAAAYIDWTFVKLSTDASTLQYAVYGLVVVLLILYARLLVIQFRRLDDFVHITPRGIVALTHRTFGGILWQKGRVETYLWSEIDSMYVDKVNFRGVGDVLVMVDEKGKLVGRIDLTYLGVSQKRLSTAVRQNSGRPLL